MKQVMKQCSFELNGKPLSDFKVGANSFPAFSGQGEHVNRQISACLPFWGPLPPGRYWIIDRTSGGAVGWLRAVMNGKLDWFALYADDAKIDDEVWCQQVKRGRFRLHPKGAAGISQGCITIDRPADFRLLRSMLRSGASMPVPGTSLAAWGVVTVR